MMKMILSLTLIWTLSSTAGALLCWTGFYSINNLEPCDSTTKLCAVSATQESVDGYLKHTTKRRCVESSDISEGKHTFSYTVGIKTVATSVHVCNTDGCNKEDIPYPDVKKKNGLHCFTCDGEHPACNKTVECVGVQDRCFIGTGISHTVGCISASLCGHYSVYYFIRLNPFLQPKCCGTNLCNSVSTSTSSVKLNVMSLLLGLLTFIFY